MDLSITELNKRYKALDTEAAIALRKFKEDATACHQALVSCDGEVREAIIKVIPEAAVIFQYTLQDIEDNANGEVEMIQTVVNSLRAHLNRRLSYYEELL